MEYLQYTTESKPSLERSLVLNLIINGIPSIRQVSSEIAKIYLAVLNLVINGIPSILPSVSREIAGTQIRFKPCYKWNTFNKKMTQKP